MYVHARAEQTGGLMPEPSSTADVRVRPTRGERAFFLLVCSFSPLFLTVFFTKAVVRVPWPLLVGFVACFVGADQVVRRNGIELTEKEAVIRSPLWKTTRVRWGLVLDVSIELTQNGRRIVLWTQGNSATEPREAHPVYVSRKQIDETFALVHSWWMAHRGY
jgi:hypothetical protein